MQQVTGVRIKLRITVCNGQSLLGVFNTEAKPTELAEDTSQSLERHIAIGAVQLGKCLRAQGLKNRALVALTHSQHRVK